MNTKFSTLRLPSPLKAAVLSGLIAGFCGTLSAQVIYNNIPAPQPGNVTSLGYEATQTSEFGAGVVFSAGSSRLLSTVKVLMASWGCVTGTWVPGGNCATPPGSTFSHPLTLNIYGVGPGNTLGPLLATRTTSFVMPYRPSASGAALCPGAPEKWFDAASGLCFNGFAFPVVFDMSSLVVTLPNQVIITVAYNTTHYGAAPLGQGTACFIAGNNCPYDSLNVGAENHLTVGAYLDPTGAFLNSATAGQYCVPGPTGTLRPDLGCWGGFQPSFQVNVVSDGAYLVHYFANLAVGDSVMNVTNTGAGIGGVDPAGNICANVYVISPDEQVIACCSCPVTPNGLVSLSARNDLVSHTLTPAVPGSITVAVLGSAQGAGNCNAASPAALVPGLAAWGSNLHLPASVTETKFIESTISAVELSRLTTFCGFLQANGSGYGICNTCRTGALGGSKK